MKQVTFYLLRENSPPDGITTAKTLAGKLAITHWRTGKRILIACENEQQAIALDDELWQIADAFVPHNLAGEGPAQGAPVELSWPERRSATKRDLLITLLPEFADFATAFHEVIDFVPDETTLKQRARVRYKSYRDTGFHLFMSPVPTD